MYLYLWRSSHTRVTTADALIAMGGYISYRYDQVADADRRVLPRRWPKIQLHARLCPKSVEGRGPWGVCSRPWTNSYPVRTSCIYLTLSSNFVIARRSRTERRSWASRWPSGQYINSSTRRAKTPSRHNILRPPIFDLPVIYRLLGLCWWQ